MISKYSVDEGESDFPPPPTSTSSGEPICLNFRGDIESPSPTGQLYSPHDDDESPIPQTKPKKKNNAKNRHDKSSNTATDSKVKKPSEENKRSIATKKKGVENSPPKSSEEIRRETRTGDKMDTYMDDYLVPFHRTKTEVLRTSYNEDENNVPDEENIEEISSPPRIKKSSEKKRKKVKSDKQGRKNVDQQKISPRSSPLEWSNNPVETNGPFIAQNSTTVSKFEKNMSKPCLH